MADDFFKGLPIYWEGTDITTPAGCTLVVTKVVGLVTTYILRDGQVIGRIEIQGNQMVGYVGGGLKGGQWVGSGDSKRLGDEIAARVGKGGES